MSTRHFLRGLALSATVAAVGLSTSLFAQEDAEATETEAYLDPMAMEALDTMSAYLRTLTSFETTSDVTTEVVLEGGQKIQFGGKVLIKVERPDAFAVTAASDTRTREMYYDGKTFTIFAPALGYYADFPAPSSIGLTLDKAKTSYGIEIPLADLFSWGTDQTLRGRVKSSMIVRPETIGDRTCMHYAYRQEQVDWQLWVEQGDTPLPCKIVITNKTDPAMPQYSAVLHWNTDVRFSKGDLAFSPPADAHKISIVDFDDEAGDAQ